PPEHVPPVFLHLLQDKVELEGTRCILSAKVSGVPVPIITWFKDGVCVSENKNYISVFKEGVSQLTILETCKEDSANWTIRASNSAGYAESHAKLLVQEKKIEEKTDDSSSKGVRQKPAFYVPLSNCTAGCKQTVVLHCIIAGCPVPAVSWFKDGVKVAEDANISLVQDKDHYRLVLVNTSPKDNGEYKVVATNSEGTSQSSCSLSIISSDPSPSTSVAVTAENAHQAMIKNSYTHSSISQVSETRSSYFSESKNRRREDKEPRFIQPILGCLVEVGARVSFEGIVDGFPSPTLGR
ncbi:myosin light chain kinase, smooth muscle, partial [Eurytemora carolleeae]|uniref:myosin light chain kinase, smooth muscle n=1 Tax=Eurytemora carolleeae TaxID=1294199 RepID=UPI000C77FB22